VQAVFPIRVCKEELEFSRTLKSVRTCCHDDRTDATLNCQKLLDIEWSPDWIATSFERMLLIDERPDASQGRPDGNKESDFY
jgi:hypothetical protein